MRRRRGLNRHRATPKITAMAKAIPAAAGPTGILQDEAVSTSSKANNSMTNLLVRAGGGNWIRRRCIIRDAPGRNDERYLKHHQLFIEDIIERDILVCSTKMKHRRSISVV